MQQIQYTGDNLLVRPSANAGDPDLILTITPQQAGWAYISFQVRRLAHGQQWLFQSGENELAIVNLSGRYTVQSNRGEWRNIGGRDNVFSGAAHALYLPRRTEFTITAEVAGEFAVTWVPTDQDHDPWLITPDTVPISIRGGDNASRQINDLLPPGSPVHRLVLVEVYTPGGNWSSYPGHKHDVHRVDAGGNLLEADLEEVYFYKMDKPHGYAYQRVYTDQDSPLHQAGCPIDVLLRAEDNCAVLVPEGYHPVVSAPGYTTYYLNVLAGSAQSLANQDDPKYAWVKQSYQGVDRRLPLYAHPSQAALNTLQVDPLFLKTLIVFPLQTEIDRFLQACAEQGYAAEVFTIGKLSATHIPSLGLLLAQGGLGKTQFALQTQHLLDACPEVDLVICAGAAGALVDALAIGDVVVATETVEHDIRNKFGSPLLPRFAGDAAIVAALGDVPHTSLAAGVRATIERFRQLQREDRLDTSDLEQ